MTEKRESWGTRIGFILSAAGFSIGLGNIWRFPYLVGTYGGGAFLLVYVAICILIGIPLFIAELGLGRKMKLTPIVGARKLAGDKPTLWSLIGWIGCIACIVLMSYYMVIIGWMLGYIVKALSGAFTNTGPADTKAMYQEFISNPVLLTGYTLVVVIAHGLIVTRGLKDGVEKVCKCLLPILGLMLVILAVRSLTMTPQVEGAKTAYEGFLWYITPDFSKITPQAVLAALGQSFFSIGIGIATAIVYGSYLKPDSNVPVDACWVVTMDTSFAFTAGIVIFPALFCYGMSPNSGVGLVFETMPIIFGRMPGGAMWGALFFFLAAIAGFTSGIGYLEAPAASFAEYFNISRKKATWGVLAVMFILGIPSILSLSSWNGYKIMGMSIFDFTDYLSGNIMMPVDALLVALYTAFVWKFENYLSENNVGVTGVIKVAGWWRYLMCYLIPIALLVILVRGL
ncbi:MAG: sodium-dependent transporter [Synergistaceae bacterium]|jgi:NSS family neurotransmitter:Na+ symporter|nr:sodium-dependent transporter [Synergistaceae bacterium]